MEEFINSAHKFGECRDKDAANNTLNKFIETIFSMGREKWLRSCPLPCHQKVYDVNVQKFHSNSMSSVNWSANAVHLFLSFDSFLIEESIESLVYDVGSFFAAGLKFINHFTI